MDGDGIAVQVLYPNLAMFTSGSFQEVGQVDLQNELIRAYNDWQLEWCGPAFRRFAPMLCIPFWDLDASTKEMERCSDLGCRGVVFTQDPPAFGLPPLVDRHWDPIWALAQERGLPINFHIGSGDFEGRKEMLSRSAGGGHRDEGSQSAHSGVVNFLGNASTIAQLVMGGVCHRFPDLNFVSVESGVGYVPFILEALDWGWQNGGLVRQHPDYLLPSEYFRRQVYACFWFERSSAQHAIAQLGSRNVMYETDFPHMTSMSPGPGMPAAVPPSQFINDALAGFAEDEVKNILFRNAARIYHLDVPAPLGA
jgi:predicted TIM-barrel fold metal-dependent hydrolase